VIDPEVLIRLSWKGLNSPERLFLAASATSIFVFFKEGPAFCRLDSSCRITSSLRTTIAAIDSSENRLESIEYGPGREGRSMSQHPPLTSGPLVRPRSPLRPS
jgi:hypothetical protein